MNQQFTTTIAGASISITITNKASAIEDYIRSVRASCTKLVNHVGLDVKSNSSDPKGKASLLLLCTAKKALVVQLQFLDYVPRLLNSLFVDPDVCFVGVGVFPKLAGLERDYGIKCVNYVEEGIFAGCPFVGLVEIARKFLGLNIEKSASVIQGDWNASVLSNEQVLSAVTDAYVAYLLCDVL